MTEHHIEIREASKPQAAEIASLIMMAMTDDCCLYFCGDGYGLEDFRSMMTMLVEREDSQYSYRNTLVASDGNKVVGISVSYDGGRLHELRRAFINAAKECLGKDHSGMDDETQAGELYLELPVLYCWPPKRGLINMGYLVSVSWLIKITPMVKHFILPSVSDMLEIADGEVIL